MKRAKSLCGIMILCVILCGIVALCDRSNKQLPGAATIQQANATLAIAQLPALPPGVTNVQCWAGGAFAKYLNVKFTALPEEAIDYFKRAGVECYFEFQENGGTYSVAATHALVNSAAPTEKPSFLELKHKSGMPGKSWFKSVYEIRHGWYGHFYHSPAGCDLYYDLDTQQLYVYWWYS